MTENSEPVLPVRDARGNWLVAMGRNGDDAPLTGVLLVVVGQAGVLLVRDVWRDQWELPGGGIEPGESPADCAGRELLEEAGLAAVELRRVGEVTFALAPEGRHERADVFLASASGAPHPLAATETDSAAWWDPRRPHPGLNPIDAAIATWAMIRRQG